MAYQTIWERPNYNINNDAPPRPNLESLIGLAKLLGVEFSGLVKFEQIQADKIDNNREA